jgi:hypothetical protein
MNTKYYPALVGAIAIAAIVLLSLDGCAVPVDVIPEPEVQIAATTTGPEPEPPGDPEPDPECVPAAGDLLVIAACIDEGETSTEWAAATGGFIADAAWEELVGTHAVAVFCEYASVAVAPYRREQVLAVLDDGLLQAPCGGAHFVHFFAP